MNIVLGCCRWSIARHTEDILGLGERGRGRLFSPLYDNHILVDEKNIRVSFRGFILYFGFFVLNWLYGLFCIAVPSLNRKTGKGAILVYGVGEESLVRKGGKDFFAFCQYGPIPRFRGEETLVVQSQKLDTICLHHDERALYFTKQPLQFLMRHAALPVQLRFYALFLQFKYFFMFVRAVLTYPE